MLEVKDFESMVEDTLTRIIDADIGITNINVGSVTRTLIEAIMAELDITQYVVYQAYISKTVDSAEGEDLDDVVSILSVIRKSASKCTGYVTFSTTEASDIDIEIPSGTLISTVQTSGGEIYEFEVVNDTILYAGETEVDVLVECTDAKYIFIPANMISVINSSVDGISEVNNKNDISGGTDEETDDELRDRAKEALVKLGRGTCDSIRSAVKDITGVIDCSVYDMRSGVGTVDVFVICDQDTPDEDLVNEIMETIENTKAAGIKAYLMYPTPIYVNIQCNITSDIEYNEQAIYELLFERVNTMTIGTSLIVNQLERMVLNYINSDKADIEFIKPVENIGVGTENIIRCNSIIINDTKYYERTMSNTVTDD